MNKSYRKILEYQQSRFRNFFYSYLILTSAKILASYILKLMIRVYCMNLPKYKTFLNSLIELKLEYEFFYGCLELQHNNVL